MSVILLSVRKKPGEEHSPSGNSVVLQCSRCHHEIWRSQSSLALDHYSLLYRGAVYLCATCAGFGYLDE